MHVYGIDAANAISIAEKAGFGPVSKAVYGDELQIPASVPLLKYEHGLIARLLTHARDDLRLAETTAASMLYWHTAEDCKNAREAVEKLIASRIG